MNKVLALSVLFILPFLGCRNKSAEIPDISESPGIEQIRRADFVETAPAYGIYSGGAFQVNIEAEDAPNIRPGEAAIVQAIPGSVKLGAGVSRVLKNVTAETRQGIAWLQPQYPRKARSLLSDGDFVFATITIRVKHNTLVIPKRGVFIKDGKTWAIVKGTDEKGKDEFKPVEIAVGAGSTDLYEVLKGLSDGQNVATCGAIGFLYPDFKAASED